MLKLATPIFIIFLSFLQVNLDLKDAKAVDYIIIIIVFQYSTNRKFISGIAK